MKISIVTISFNQANFLEETINSVLSQNYDNFEYIIVDPGSTDGSRDIIEKYRGNIAKIIYEKDEGPADGLNKGFTNATGDIYFYLNSDDTILPNTFKYVNSFFKTNPGIDVLSGHGYAIDENSTILHKIYSQPFSLKSYAAGCCVLVQQSTFFKPNIFNDIGGFNINNKICWDGELMVDFALRNAKFKQVKEFLSCFRIHKSSITGSGLQQSSKFYTEKTRINNKILEAGFSPRHKYIEYTLTRLQSPFSTFDRLVDGFKHRKRYV